MRMWSILSSSRLQVLIWSQCTALELTWHTHSPVLPRSTLTPLLNKTDCWVRHFTAHTHTHTHTRTHASPQPHTHTRTHTLTRACSILMKCPLTSGEWSRGFELAVTR